MNKEIWAGAGMRDLRFTIFVFALLAVLATVMAGYGYYVSQRDQAVKDAHAEATTHLEIVRGHVLSHLERHRKSVRSLSRFHGFQDLFVKPSPEIIARVDESLRYLRDTLDVDVCYILDQRGIAISSSNSGEKDSFIGHDYSFRPYFQRSMAGETVTYSAVGITSRKRGIYFSHPFYQEGRSAPVGVIVIKGSVAQLDIDTSHVKEGEILLLDPHGMIFSSSKPEWLLQFLWQPAPEVVASLRDSRQYGDGPWPSLGMVREGEYRIVHEGKKVYQLHSQEIAGFPEWRLVFLHDQAAIRQRVYSPLFRAAMYAVIGLCLVVGLVTFLLYRKAWEDIKLRRDTEKRIAAHNAFLKNVIESLPYPFYVVNAEDYTIVLGNSLAMGGKQAGAVKCHELTHHRDSPCESDEHLCPLAEVKRTGEPVVTEHVHQDASGNPRYIEVHGYPIFDNDGRVVQMIEATLDVSDRRALENKLHAMTITDELTGLLNRRGFLVMAGQQLKVAQREQKRQYLLYADLDNMKWINDTLGHEQGDQALKEAADFLVATFRESDVISRLGGDEFVALLAAGKESTDAERIHQRFVEGLAAVNSRPDRLFTLEISVGLSEYDPAQPLGLERLITKADAAMYAAKEAKGRDGNKG